MEEERFEKYKQWFCSLSEEDKIESLEELVAMSPQSAESALAMCSTEQILRALHNAEQWEKSGSLTGVLNKALSIRRS